jgi:hypothetical protein
MSILGALLGGAVGVAIMLVLSPRIGKAFDRFLDREEKRSRKQDPPRNH